MSSEINEHVTITTTENSVGITSAGFGTQGIASCNATFPERSRSYKDPSEMLDDGYTTSSPEHRAASKAFAQKPRPKTVKLLNVSGAKPTMRYQVDVLSVANATKYGIKVKGNLTTIADTTCEYTSDASATNDEIVGGLLALINAIANKNFTATSTGAGGSLDLVITADTAGVWFSVEITSTKLMKVEATHAVPVGTTLTAELTAVAEEDNDWYGLSTDALGNSDAVVKECAAFVESAGKMYVPSMSDSTVATAVYTIGDGDTATDIKNLAYKRTAIAYHPNPAAFIGPAWFGRLLPTEPGRATWKFKTLAGVENVVLTTTQRTNIRAKNANSYTKVGQKNMMWEGKRADGGFIDTTRNIDWLDDRLQVRVFNAFSVNDIVPFTDAGIQIVRNEVEAALAEAVERGILAGGDESPVVTVPLAADVAEDARGARNLPDINWSGRLAGAVHNTDVIGNVQA